MALSPVIGKLLHKRVVLASASPRRREILSQAVSGLRRGWGGEGRPGTRGLGPGLVTWGPRPGGLQTAGLGPGGPEAGHLGTWGPEAY